jgi:hypothetical protein
MSGAKTKRRVLPLRRARSILSALIAGTAVLSGGAACAADMKPDLSGLWVASGNIRLLKTEQGTEPPLRAEARVIYERNLALRQKGDVSFDTSSRCMPPGVPRIAYLSRFRILQRPELIGFIYEWNHRSRLAFIDAQHKFADDALFLGDSVAHWEGRELVVDVASLSDRTLLDDALPHSESLHIVERYYLKDGGRTLVDEIMVEDPATFLSPWKTVVQFKKQPAGVELAEDVCADRVNLFGG